MTPSHLATEEHPSPAPAANSTDHTERPRVLLVDDEDNILASLRRLLRREPYELVTASSGAEALEVLATTPCQLVMTDFRMPGMTGVELLQEVQQRWPDVIRVILSGYSEVRAIIAAINEGSLYKFLTKPWNDEEIKLNIRRALEQYALESENRRLAVEIGEQNEELRRLNERLHQRATDAAAGQACAQELLESVAAGVVTVDQTGLIVSANNLASDWLTANQMGLIGMTANDTLPEALAQLVTDQPPDQVPPAAGTFEQQGRHLQWRLQPVKVAGTCRGTLITLWETVR